MFAYINRAGITLTFLRFMYLFIEFNLIVFQYKSISAVVARISLCFRDETSCRMTNDGRTWKGRPAILIFNRYIEVSKKDLRSKCNLCPFCY